MNLKKLFETQALLDKKIVEEKGLQGADLLDKKILALLTELGELSNEWNGFKFWKVDPKPNTNFYITSHKPNEPFVVKRNPLLEEFVDCLHFILSIGNGFDYVADEDLRPGRYYKNITLKFIRVYDIVLGVYSHALSDSEFAYADISESYESLLVEFMTLGSMLGFTTDQIERAYYDKNEINHERQEQGY